MRTAEAIMALFGHPFDDLSQRQEGPEGFDNILGTDYLTYLAGHPGVHPARAATD